MTFGNEGEALVALTTGRATPEDLREIVTSYPQLRATVALYPATDAPLLHWLSDLGDPAVALALARRTTSSATPESWKAAEPAFRGGEAQPEAPGETTPESPPVGEPTSPSRRRR